MEQGGNGRRRNRRGRQPGAHRQQRRLDAKTEKGNGKHCAQQGFVPGNLLRVQNAAQGKRHRRAPAGADKDYRDKAERGAGHGKEQIPLAGEARPVIPFMHDQRHRRQGQQFKKEVQGQEVSRKGDPGSDAVGKQKESKKTILVFLVLHIVESVQRRRRPQQRDDAEKNP